MFKRIESKTTSKTRRLVAKIFRRKTVRNFVYHHGHNKYRDIKYRIRCIHINSMIACGNCNENMRDNKKGFNHGRWLFKPNSRHQIQPDRQSPQTPKSPKEENFRAGNK